MGRRVNTAKWMPNQNRWQINVQKDGVRRSFTSSTPGRTGQREANAKADKWLDDNIDRSNVRIYPLFCEFIEDLKIETRRGHWSQYASYGRNWILPKLGRIKISNLTEQNLQNVINAAYKHGLAKKTLTNIRSCITAFLKFCRKNNATKMRPENLTIPRCAPVKKKLILQPNELALLFNCDKTIYRNKEIIDPSINAYRFATLTGLRPGELFGLKNEDISGDVINIRRSINGYGEETAGKNDNARRSFKLFNITQKILEDQKKYLKENGIESEYVFCDPYGKPIKQNNYYKHWTRFRKYNGISDVTPYGLRHTFISAVKCMPTGLLKQLVGHSPKMDTYGVYSHELDGDMDLAAKELQNIFGNYINGL